MAPFDQIATYERVRDDVTAMKDEIERLYVVEFNSVKRGNRLGRIAEAHHKNVDQHGGTDGMCNECNWHWPCPTYVWATEDRDSLACWDPRDDDSVGTVTS